MKHIENTVLGSLEKIDAMIKEHRAWNEESKDLGLIEDSEKLRMLKRDLYCEARLSNPNQQKISNLTDAIQTFEEIKHAEETRKFERLKHSYTFPVQLEVFTNTCILLVITVIAVSYLASFTCGTSNSMFCAYARSNVYPINKFFSDPNAKN